MTWEQRTKQAAYTSPSGTRVVFDYENVSKNLEKKTTPYTFAGADGTYIQDLGNAGNQYPVRAFFHGPDCDLEADKFEKVLLERGDGKLEHPLYGTKTVVPSGTITRTDNLTSGANQSIIEITFFSTIGLIYPSSINEPAVNTVIAVDEYNEAASESFEENVELDSEVEKSDLKSKVKSFLGTVRTQLKEIAAEQQDVFDTFNDIELSINEGLELLIGQPLTMASQMLLFTQAPARAISSIQARLEAYGNLSNGIIKGLARAAKGITKGIFGTIFEKGGDSKNSNTFFLNDLIASAAVTGSIISVINTQFETKPQAIRAAQSILEQMDDLVNWRDVNFKSLEKIDTGEAYQKLREAVSIAAGYLVEISFDLKQERIITLDRDRTFIDLTAELYGAADEKYDFFINTNDLSISEHIEIKAGRQIRYYV